MRFIIDENAGPSVAKWLSTIGHEVFSVYDEIPRTPDEEILDKAAAENYIIITSDKDFGELVFKQNRTHRGIILLRLINETTANKIRVLNSLLEQLSDQLSDRFTVVTDSGVRIY